MRTITQTIREHVRKKLKVLTTSSTSPTIEENESRMIQQVLVALGPLILTVDLGMISGYSAILLPQLSQKDSIITIDEEQSSWIASMAALAMAIGSIFGGIFCEKFGRKSTHFCTCFPLIVGWLFIYFANNIQLILTGRFLTGICTGVLGSSSGVYIGETSEPQYRGILLGGLSFAVSLGLLLSHVLGTFLHWQTTALICGLLPILSLLILVFVPESPSWLAKNGKIKEAEESFIWCRGYSNEAKKELNILLQKQDAETKGPTSCKETLKELSKAEFLKPLGIVGVFIIVNQWAGVNAITFYTISIMKNTVGNNLSEYVAMFIVDVIRVIMSTVACVLMKMYPRRPLANISGIGTSLSLLILSGYLWFIDLHPKAISMPYIPIIALVSFIAFVSIGYVPLPWALQGEIFPVKSRAIGSGISSFLAFTAFFSVVKTSPSMMTNLKTSGTFFIYGLVALGGTIFVYLFLPETKGKRLHEIEDHFRNKKCNSSETDINCKV